MNIKLRSIGFGAIGAVALTLAALHDRPEADVCSLNESLVADECRFETLMWDLVRNSPDEGDVEAYITMFPNGRYLTPAKERLSKLLPGYGVIRDVPSSAS